MTKIDEKALKAALDKGEYVLSEWLNDSAPLGQRMYRAPAAAAFSEMLPIYLAALPPSDPVAVPPLSLREALKQISRLIDENAQHRDSIVRLKGDLFAASCRREHLEAENARLREALRDVCDPMGYLQRKADEEDARLSGEAYAIANDLSFVKRIARAALGEDRT